MFLDHFHFYLFLLVMVIVTIESLGLDMYVLLASLLLFIFPFHDLRGNNININGFCYGCERILQQQVQKQVRKSSGAGSMHEVLRDML